MPTKVNRSIKSHFLKLPLALAGLSLGILALSPDSAPAQQQERFLEPATFLPNGRAFHGVAVLRGFIYAIGGSVDPGDGSQVSALTTHVAQVYPDGRISGWIPTERIPSPRHYIANSTVVVNDTVYVLGGSSEILSGERADTVIWTRPQRDGRLEPWRTSDPFPPAALSTIAAFSTPGYIHITGGLPRGTTPSNETWSVRVNPDGSLGEWVEGPRMPQRLWFHCAEVVGARAYIWGGLTEGGSNANRSTSTAIYSAPILGSGLLGDWVREDKTLPVGIYSATSAVAGPFLFTFSPRYDGGQMSNDIVWTRMTPEGMVPWTLRRTELRNAIYHATATDYRLGHIYVVGGKGPERAAPIPHASYIKLSEGARRMAEQAWLAQHGPRAGEADTTESIAETQLLPPAASADLPSYFFEYAAAQNLSNRERRPLIVYYQNDVARGCQEQAELLSDPRIQELSERAIFAAVDVRELPQIAQQNAVFRVPTWVFYNSDGSEEVRRVGVQSVDNLRERAGQLR
ncbi:MAG: hypothetical protein JJU11_01490 [Candidatus Sumerlaeia bacterium]|nr:hypothetical protein [Candidatus Sumerlaeia bacterium]